jgi:hypothetical protein
MAITALRSLAGLCAVTLLAAATPAAGKIPIDIMTPVDLTVTIKTPLGNDTYIAYMAWYRGSLNGTLSSKGLTVCTVQTGSSDIADKLSLVCSKPVLNFTTSISLTGTLDILSGRGHGNAVITGEAFLQKATFTTTKYVPPG